MVEVFKTNVRDPNQAQRLIKAIHLHYKGYQANFDLEDCDSILRVSNATGVIQTSSLITFLSRFDLEVEALVDEN